MGGGDQKTKQKEKKRRMKRKRRKRFEPRSLRRRWRVVRKPGKAHCVHPANKISRVAMLQAVLRQPGYRIPTGYSCLALGFAPLVWEGNLYRNLRADPITKRPAQQSGTMLGRMAQCVNEKSQFLGK